MESQPYGCGSKTNGANGTAHFRLPILVVGLGRVHWYDLDFDPRPSPAEAEPERAGLPGPLRLL